VQLIADRVTYCHRGQGTALLRELSLQVRAGDSVAVIGPSGSGKSTLLGLLGGLLVPASGEVRLEQAAGDGLAKHVSWILQTVNVLADRTVQDNIALGAYADGCARTESLTRADAALDLVGLDGRGREKVRTLSGGEVQRVVIARALVSRRPVLLADEPTGQLDRATSEEVVSSLLTAAADRVLVVVTHDDTVAGRCGAVYRLHDGRLVPA